MNCNNRAAIFRFIVWFFLANTLLFWLLGSEYLKAILLSKTLFINTVANFTSIGGRTFVIFFAIINYLSYMMLLAFIPATVLILIAYCLPNRWLIWALSILLSTVSIVFLIADTRIYLMFKFHLNFLILSLAFHTQWNEVFDFSARELTYCALLIAAVCLIEICLAWLVWKKIVLAERLKVGHSIAYIWLGGFLFSYFTLVLSIAKYNNLFSQQIPNLPLYNQIVSYLIPDKNAKQILNRYSESNFAQPIFSNDKLNYPLHTMSCDKQIHPYNIILIMVDSLRFDSLQKEYMPNVAQFAKKTWHFQNHMSGGNSTQPGLFSIFYSIPSSYWTAALKQQVPAILTDLLIKYGYSTHVFWSSVLYNPPFDKTIFTGFNDLDINGSHKDNVGDKDRDITQKAIDFLNTKNHKKPFFLYLFYDAPHGFCRQQKFPAPYQPIEEECSRINLTNEINPLPFYNRYLNAVNFDDQEIAKVLNRIEQQGYLDNSIVIFTADHGQEFNDNKQNYWGHAGNFTQAQIHVPLFIHWPGQSPRSIEYLTTSYDIVPTLVKHLFNCNNPTHDYSIGQDLLIEKGRLPFFISGSYINMGVVEQDRLTTLQVSGDITITNPRAEPTINAEPRVERIKNALTIMRQYYAK
ncbi:sulfatase-like hydrolase/transferase [Legionella sp.]|uniref:DUF3413 domain-containing protein n=1 Tax=Legionella sp. TaxID=459 RepID=UPI000CB26323|nr:sulfatase-like hydrolase/transferase [Legionella sp.]PJE13524.1 MAG: sulfatase [Legionella sp.]